MKKTFPGLIWLMLWLLSWLPGFILLFLAYLINLVTFALAQYRTDIVQSNLSRSFPELDLSSRNEIANKFYQHFAELFMEMVLFTRLRPRKKSRYIRFSNPDVLSQAYDKHQNIIIIAGHYGNWEWNLLSILATGYRVIAVYKPQSSQMADELMKIIRTKPGISLVPMKETLRVIKREIKENNSPFALLLVADQIPARGDIHFWTRFLNQDTAFFTGGEKLAKRFGFQMFYLDQVKLRFARYQSTISPVYDGKADLPEGTITTRFAEKLEASVRREPSIWLWTHRRWKYRREELPLHP